MVNHRFSEEEIKRKRQTYMPKGKVKILFIGESPPKEGFFYDEKWFRKECLFNHVMSVIFSEKKV